MRKTIIPIPNDELSIFEKKLSNIFCVYIVDLMMVRRWNIANWAQFLIFRLSDCCSVLMKANLLNYQPKHLNEHEEQKEQMPRWASCRCALIVLWSQNQKSIYIGH